MNRNYCVLKSNVGFSLLELMVTVAVLAVITTLAVPSFNDFMERQAIRGDIQRFNKILTIARSLAMTTNDGASRVCWNPTDSAITIDGADIPPRTIAAFAGTSTLEATQSIDEKQSVYRTNEADGCIGFDAQGRLSDATSIPVAFTICRDANDSTDSQRLEVAATGRVVVRPNTSNRGANVQSCA